MKMDSVSELDYICLYKILRSKHGHGEKIRTTYLINIVDTKCELETIIHKLINGIGRMEQENRGYYINKFNSEKLKQYLENNSLAQCTEGVDSFYIFIYNLSLYGIRVSYANNNIIHENNRYNEIYQEYRFVKLGKFEDMLPDVPYPLIGKMEPWIRNLPKKTLKKLKIPKNKPCISMKIERFDLLDPRYLSHAPIKNCKTILKEQFLLL